MKTTFTLLTALLLAPLAASHAATVPSTRVTTVSQQQLFVLNSPFMMEMSREFAKRLGKAAPDDQGRLQAAWQLTYGRPPTVPEIATAMEFLNAPVEPAPADQLNLWEQLSHALLASNELIILP